MRLYPSTRAARSSVLTGILLSLPACGWEPLASDTPDAVVMSLAGSQSVDPFVTIGDVDTVLAAVLSAGWPTQTLHESRTSPERFTFHSSNPTVATVGPTGVVRSLAAGTTILTASYENLVSAPMQLSVSPRAVELRASPDAIEAVTGDSIALTIIALDDGGRSVAGVFFGIGPDTSYWAVTSPPREGTWRLETPRVLHMRANRAGAVRLTAFTLNERQAARLLTHLVTVTVRDP